MTKQAERCVGAGFVRCRFQDVKHFDVVDHYAQTVAAAVVNRGVRYELLVCRTASLYSASLVARTPSRAVKAITTDANVFLAVRDAFDDLNRQLAQLALSQTAPICVNLRAHS